LLTDSSLSSLRLATSRCAAKPSLDARLSTPQEAHAVPGREQSGGRVGHRPYRSVTVARSLAPPQHPPDPMTGARRSPASDGAATGRPCRLGRLIRLRRDLLLAGLLPPPPVAQRLSLRRQSPVSKLGWAHRRRRSPCQDRSGKEPTEPSPSPHQPGLEAVSKPG